MVDEVFDFAERVMKGQRKMVSDMVKTIDQQSRRTVKTGQGAAARAVKKAPAKRSAPAKKASGKKRSAAGV